ncbi:MAG TPA: diaminopimelate decarboxylase [Candidatus Odoribacter faecigallinarum]|uniref:Diaminopimelate decarboxylase n=1 Tax=Candidatus Odoribacter faecigallinarum TaxID=2838706 RepID=A0A9D1V142_9BACT|nr:diaminopimelate decarboxylase [Candidatus Odoribacter faecigallinarum]
MQQNILPEGVQTPYYFYDTGLLDYTLDLVQQAALPCNYRVHYAVKANANPVLLRHISHRGLGADCVSGNEIRRALECGFAASDIVYAGVGKTDREIEYALRQGIYCFNCESLPEIEVIDGIAGRLGMKARIALRVNPNVDAHTHHYITTGIEENKFGIYLYDLRRVIAESLRLAHVELLGLHFHIGSQITDMTVFRGLCLRVNEILEGIRERGVNFSYINFGGGLGIDYQEPDEHPCADFKAYFNTFAEFFQPTPHLQVHFELGRSIVAQCGSLISTVLYVKEGKKRKFVVLDAGMNDLLRPALYQAYHKIENVTSRLPEEKYDVVGPVCESADCFGKDVTLPATRRGDMIAIRSCGAYGEAMASRYNLRDLAPAVYWASDQG